MKASKQRDQEFERNCQRLQETRKFADFVNAKTPELKERGLRCVALEDYLAELRHNQRRRRHNQRRRRHNKRG